jgi:hypothetical protein
LAPRLRHAELGGFSVQRIDVLSARHSQRLILNGATGRRTWPRIERHFFAAESNSANVVAAHMI